MNCDIYFITLNVFYIIKTVYQAHRQTTAIEKMDSNNTVPHITSYDLNNEILKLSLSLYNLPHISRKDVDVVINMLDDFVSRKLIPFIQNEMQCHVKPLSNEASFSKTQFILENVKDLFRKISTEHLRFKLYEEKSTFIPPQLFEVGQECTYVIDDDKKVTTQMKPVYAAYVCMKDTLQAALSIPGVLQSIFTYMSDLRKEKDCISNVIQGELWAKKYENTDKIVLPIYLYFDKFET